MPLPTNSFAAHSVHFWVYGAPYVLEISVPFPNLGASENDDLNDAAHAAVVAAMASLQAAYPSGEFQILRRYEGYDGDSQVDITPAS